MFRGTWAVLAAWLGAGCGAPPDTAVSLKPSTLRTTDVTASQRLAACALDPRVRAGALSAPACAAGELFAARPAAFAVSEGSGVLALRQRSVVVARGARARAPDRMPLARPRRF